MGAAMSVMLLVVDTDKYMAQITAQMPLSLNIKGVSPLFAAAVMAMMNAVCMSVSMEGKEWWIVKSLPLETKTILDGKLMFNLLLIAPFFAVGQICLMIALKPGFLDGALACLLSAGCVIFSCVFGLWINLLFPKMDWENETVAVKQSASSMLGGIGGVLVTLVFAIALAVVPGQYFWMGCAAEIGIIIWLTYKLYKKNNQMLLERI